MFGLSVLKPVGLPRESIPVLAGASWFFARSSAPAWKWQEAQAVRPSLPVCMSQKSALPRRFAAASSATYWERFEGLGTVMVLSARFGNVGGGLARTARTVNAA